MFVAVMETGSFTAAAARLGTSSGQASKLVSRLEAELGVRLLNRTTRAVSATEAGQAYFERIRPLLEEFDILDLSIKNSAQVPRGRLRLTAPLTFGTMELTPALNDFAMRYPEIDLEVSFTDRVVSLVDEGFDMAVRVGRTEDSSLIARKLCDVRIVLVGAERYLARRGEPTVPGDLAGHDCIADTNFREPNLWRFRAADGEPLAIPVAGRLRYSNAEACLQAAEAGLGLAYVPGFVAGPALRTGRVRRLLEAFEPAPFGVHALYPHSRHLAAKVRALVDCLIERYRGAPHWENDW
ncbi:LysR family transcriptional regulator [Roseomonas sp. E05]|uniref:LysR family transcriptional regulator n=1 Tax=Roseomonas sp. E05 TaxID=3046310 RepID=UPI0024B9BAA6|nr:LysR family transcriptional regulator [Roseomonas sp. E05]MDJ0391287.1 LysR family transcriptional regulator [Roseomonas sp. E05]